MGMSELRGPDDFPRGKAPEASYVQSDVTTTTSAEKVVNTLYCQHIKAGQRIMIQGMVTIALGAGADKVDVDIVQGTTTSGTDVGEASETLVTASKDAVCHQMVVTNAYQDKPTYSMTIACASASANCVAQSSCLMVIPIA
jgi:hypothetical protein